MSYNGDNFYRDIDARWFGSNVGKGGDDSGAINAALAAAASLGGRVRLSGPGPYHANVTMPNTTSLIGDMTTVLRPATYGDPTITMGSFCTVQGLDIIHSGSAGIYVGSAGSIVSSIDISNCKFETNLNGILFGGQGAIGGRVVNSTFSACNNGILSPDGLFILNNFLFDHCQFLAPQNVENTYQVSLGGDSVCQSSSIKFHHCLFNGDARQRLGRALRFGVAPVSRIGTVHMDTCQFVDWGDPSDPTPQLEVITNLPRVIKFSSCRIGNNAGNIVSCESGGCPRFVHVDSCDMHAKQTGCLPFVGVSEAEGFVFTASRVGWEDPNPLLEMDFGDALVSWIGCQPLGGTSNQLWASTKSPGPHLPKQLRGRTRTTILNLVKTPQTSTRPLPPRS